MGYILVLLGFLGVFVGLALLIIGVIKKKKMKGGLVLGISVAAFIVGFIMVPTNSTDSTNDSNEKDKVETVAKSNDDKPATVTPDEFNKLKNGMSLEEVEKIVGGKPKNPDAKENDNLILIWEYDGENGIEKDSPVSLIFKDGKLNTIQQLGLIIEKETEEEKAAREAKDAEENKLDYTIQEEKISGSIWYVTLLTSLTEENDLRKLVELTSDLAKSKKEKIDSIFVKVNIKNSLAKSYAATGKVALSDMGLIQTKLKIINNYEFKYLVTEEHLTSKDDLKQSNESYSAEDILKAFQDAGLPTTDSRDNSHNCVDLECTTLITTEDVSIYEWPSVEKAQEVRAKNFGDAQVGTIIIRMNNKSLDIQKYIDVMNNVVNK
ncbi:hypothetical protein [Lysinibacillus xylanilyticus]|uniref:hypothetical protein n=1 Tax=Lysinibacillus xylanilyticus TaxID=582475 RepID=UPI00083C9499|nr:hypothetical protein [Lysinibacillus xylanilyticus]